MAMPNIEAAIAEAKNQQKNDAVLGLVVACGVPEACLVG